MEIMRKTWVKHNKTEQKNNCYFAVQVPFSVRFK